jgi:DnaJ family protein C protein 11
MKAGTFGAIMEYGVEERITGQSSLSATMGVGFPVGVTCRLKLTRWTNPIFTFHQILSLERVGWYVED